jgi:hypothetical protein
VVGWERCHRLWITRCAYMWNRISVQILLEDVGFIEPFIVQSGLPRFNFPFKR